MSKVHSGLAWTDFTYPYLAPDTHVFIEAPAVTVRTDEELIQEGITTDDFDNDYYWDNYGGNGNTGTVVVMD